MSSVKKSIRRAPLEDINLFGTQRIRRWLAEVRRESKIYHDVDTPSKSMEDSDDYRVYPQQEASLENSLSKRSTKPEILPGLEGPQSAPDTSTDRHPRHPRVSKKVHKHKRDTRELQEEPPNKRRPLGSDVSSSLNDGLLNRAVQVGCCGERFHTLNESASRLLLPKDAISTLSSPVISARGTVKGNLRRTLAQQQKSYERQPRRKTREDKYEPKVTKKISKSRVKERKKTTQAPRALNFDFKAPNVLQNRLTLKSGQHLGIFSKGKASSCIRRRGLPDLTFPEMNFLSGHRDYHVEPDSHGVVQRMSQKKLNESDHDKMAERFSRPLMNQDRAIYRKGLSHHNFKSASARSPIQSGYALNLGDEPRAPPKIAPGSLGKSGRSQGRGVPSTIPKIVSGSPRKYDMSRNNGVLPIPPNGKNKPLQYAPNSTHNLETGEAAEDHMDRSIIHSLLSTSTIDSQRTNRQPLAYMPKEYLSLDDLHRLSLVRQREDEGIGPTPSSPGQPGEHGVHISLGTPSRLRAAEFQQLQIPQHLTRRQDMKLSQPARNTFDNLASVVNRGLPEIYARQVIEQENVEPSKGEAFEDRSGRSTFIPGRFGQSGLEIEPHDVFRGTHMKINPSSPLGLWTDPQAALDDDIDIWGFKSSKSGRWSSSWESPQKTVLSNQGPERELVMLPGRLLGDSGRPSFLGGMGDLLKDREASRRDDPPDVSRSALLVTQQEVNATLEAKGFWRRRVL